MMSDEMLGRWKQRLPHPDLDQVIPLLTRQCSQAKHLHDRLELCNRTLLKWVQDQTTPCFLLAGVLAYIRAVNEAQLTKPLRYQISSFEGWLSRRSGCSEEQQRNVRGRIMGQLVPREEYERFFPIGQGRILPSSHIVTGHSSPDLDTTTASFWTWCDAWAAPIAERLHYWNVPGGLPNLVEMEILFKEPFGPQLSELPKARATLALTAYDLLSRQEPLSVRLDASLSVIPVQQLPVAVLDQDGVLVGELRQQDVDRVRQITNPFMAFLHWFERYTEQVLVDFLAQDHERSALPLVLERLFAVEMRQADPFRYENAEQQQYLAQMVRVIWNLPEGERATFGNMAIAAALLTGGEACPARCERLAQGYVKGPVDGGAGFLLLSQIAHALSDLSDAFRQILERVDQALTIKSKVLEVPETIVQGAADVEELLQRMGDHHALLSAVIDETGSRLLEGMITAEDLRRQPVGTVSTRDFCNREEVKIPAYFEVVSVIDHHKASLQTSRPPVAFLADVQSVNTLMAEQTLAFQLSYAYGGVNRSLIEAQLETLSQISSPSSIRRRVKLLSKLQALDAMALKKDSKAEISTNEAKNWIAPERQWWQAVQFVFAILDDTDLLMKVTWRDLYVVMNLLNLMASLESFEEIEVVAFDDLAQSQENLSIARTRLLDCELLVGLLNTVLDAKQKALNYEIEEAAAGHGASLFADLKIQNRCAAVGQIKIFDSNRDLFIKHEKTLQGVWLEKSQEMTKQRPEIDLFIEMISTIFEPGSEHDKPVQEGKITHYDALWIWVPPPEASRVHLRVFLANLANGPLAALSKECQVKLIGPENIGLERLFKEHFEDVVSIGVENRIQTGTYAVLEFPEGTLNSRKGTITPNLPQLGS